MANSLCARESYFGVYQITTKITFEWVHTLFATQPINYFLSYTTCQPIYDDEKKSFTFRYRALLLVCVFLRYVDNITINGAMHNVAQNLRREKLYLSR